ncbi:MAG: hypothetical protein ACRYG2_05235 [Janthinobacterium lividum]
MPYVLTVDQRDSRNTRDEVDRAVAELAGVSTLLGFRRTVGDEFQGLLDDPVSVLGAILGLMRTRTWHLGVGIGPVDRPLPADGDPTRAHGPAFVAARDAVEQAKSDPHHVAVVAPGAPDEAYDVKAVLDLLDTVRQGRTRAGWEVADLALAGLTQAASAERLSISRQAVQQRLRAAGWAAEDAARPTLVRLLARAQEAAR